VSTPGWQDAWNTRIDSVDAEHRELVALLQDLTERFTRVPGGAHHDARSPAPRGETPPARDASTDHDALIAALERLGEHAREHFRHEEELMRLIDYPEIGAHRSEHVLLLAEYVEMVRDLKKQATTHLDPETVSALRQWLVGHMLSADKEYADFYFAMLAGDDESSR
jgi:hemerythrin